jgi:hypothetical protein
MRAAGGPPTGTVGRPAAVGAEVTISGFRVIEAWRAIRDTAATENAVMHVECVREYRQ